MIPPNPYDPPRSIENDNATHGADQGSSPETYHLANQRTITVHCPVVQTLSDGCRMTVRVYFA